MKKLILSVLLLMALSLTLLCGCGGTGEEAAAEDTAPAQEETQVEETPFFLGNWIAKTAVVNGSTVDAMDVFGGIFVLTLKEDGYCQMGLNNQYSTLDWTDNGDGTITLTGSDTYEVSFPDGSEDTMLAVIKGVDVTLEKSDE